MHLRRQLCGAMVRRIELLPVGYIKDGRASETGSRGTAKCRRDRSDDGQFRAAVVCVEGKPPSCTVIAEADRPESD